MCKKAALNLFYYHYYLLLDVMSSFLVHICGENITLYFDPVSQIAITVGPFIFYLFFWGGGVGRLQAAMIIVHRNAYLNSIYFLNAVENDLAKNKQSSGGRRTEPEFMSNTMFALWINLVSALGVRTWLTDLLRQSFM